jgi:hypothetical protein
MINTATQEYWDLLHLYKHTVEGSEKALELENKMYNLRQNMDVDLEWVSRCITEGLLGGKL